MLRRWMAGPILLVALAGCGVGTGTMPIAEAEAEVVAAAEAIIVAVGLAPTAPIASAPLEQCQLRTGEAGLRTRVAVRAPLGDGPDALPTAIDAAATVLVARDLAIVESGVPGTVLGQRDGLTITIGSDGRVLEIDALTGCRPR